MGAASAATVTKASAAQVANSTYTVNGISVNLATFFEKGKTLVSLRELSLKLGAKLQTTKGVIKATLTGHTVELMANSTLIKVDGAEQQLTVPVKSVKGVTYVELKAFVQALGGQFAKDASGTIWIDADLLGTVDRIQWVDSATFIATQETETGRLDYLVDAKTAKYEQLRILEEISDFVIAPNGAKAAYTNNAGEVSVIDFTTKQTTKVSEDTSIKPELVWSSDSSAIYFLQGDKGSVIAKLDPATGTISKILEDKVDYKANLDVSTDGKTLTYTVTKPGAVVADASKPVENDDVTIDMKGTEPQIFAYTVDPSIKDNKAVQLTTSTDDKVFIHAAADGSNVGYVSVSSEESVKSTLILVGKDKTAKTLFSEKDVYQAVVSGGKWYLLTEGNGSNQFVYEVDPATGAAVKSVWKSGDPYVIVGGGVKSPSDIFWIVPENSSLRSVRDLVGKRVSYTSPGSVTEQVLILTLSRAGIDPASVQLIAAGGIGEGFALLKRGEVDACAMLPSSFTERAGFRVLFNAWDTVPNYFQTLILAHRRLVERNPEAIRSFLAARRWGVEQIQKDPEGAAQVYAKTANISPDLAREAIRFAGAERGRYYSDGRLDPEGLRLAEEGMRIAKEIGPDERVPWTQLVNQSFLADDQRVQLP